MKYVLLVALIAIAVYFAVQALDPGGDLPRRTHRRPTRPHAPDDDDEFLRDLDRKRLHPEDPDSG